MSGASIDVVFDLDFAVPKDEPPARPPSWAGAPRVATPVAGAPRVATPIAGAPRVATPLAGAPLAAPAVAMTEAILLDYPEPAIIFDARGVCTGMNERAAQELRVNRKLAVGCGIKALRLPPALEAAIRYLTDPAAALRDMEREVICTHGTGARRFFGTVRPGLGQVLVTWTDVYPVSVHLEIVEP
jgi:hypothetical protein